MREIKFRVWDNETNKFWHEGRNLALVSLVPDNLINDDSTVLEQYTGLKDKNGVQIYEGDILQHKASKFINFTVLFKYGCYYAHDTSEIMSDELLGSLNFDNEMTVIGNIHENPELLEVEE
ncbi:hypothetical protein FOL01_1334 [Weissella jogaejeotgali]|uniref:YopX protein domain-containing protein n=1 Tax=Weissella jogaejeotgali TaxID=1631871 RepID=A0A1L6RCD8_9LACO|nr:YopX family protein [Weissella jogaejeotgali]APS42193.1 hypothetical protein FOL01_1334 [Weissella jogaejeotgali]